MKNSQPPSVFGRSNQPKRQNRAMEDHVVALMSQGYTQDQALDLAEQENPVSAKHTVIRTGTYCTETGVESGTVTTVIGGTTSLLDHLQEQGYEPVGAGDWYDLTVSGTGTVRVFIDRHRCRVYLLDHSC